MADSGFTSSFVVGQPAPPCLQPMSEDELLAGWSGSREPLVSIVCATYNHRRFIREALDGFFAQRTDFSFEVLVRDDASSDGTSEILLEYARRYPRLLRVVIEPHNTYSRGVSPLAALGALARGEFIANCEGDDYWISPDKLTLQIEALRTGSGAALCFHDVITIRDGVVVRAGSLPASFPERVPPEDLALPISWFPMPVSWMYRRAAFDFNAPEFGQVVNQDNLLLSQLSLAGSAIRLPGQLAAYRLHPQSIHSSKSERQQLLARLNSFLWISRYHFRTGCGRLGRRFALAAATLASHELRTFGRSVTWWTVVMLAKVMLAESLDPGGRLRRARVKAPRA